MSIDYAGFPHLVEEIIDLADPDVLAVLRLVSRSVRDRVDQRLQSHLILADNRHSAYITPIWSDDWLERPSSARILDLYKHHPRFRTSRYDYPSNSFSAKERYPRLKCDYPMLKYIRFMESPDVSAPFDPDSPPTLILPVRLWQNQEYYDNGPLFVPEQCTSVQVEARKAVFVLRCTPGQGYIKFRFYTPIKFIVVVVLPGHQPPARVWPNEDPRRLPVVNSLVEAIVDGMNMPHTTGARWIIAGLETWEKGGKGYEVALSDELTWPERLKELVLREGRWIMDWDEPMVRRVTSQMTFLTLEDWRRAVGEEEWELVTGAHS